MSDTMMLSFEINRYPLSVLSKDPEHFLQEVRLAAALRCSELGILSQSKAVEVTGISRGEVLASLLRVQISPLQYLSTEPGHHPGSPGRGRTPGQAGWRARSGQPAREHQLGKQYFPHT